MNIYIDNRQDKIKLDSKIDRLLEAAVYESLKLEGKDKNYELSISFVDNAEIRKLNRDYRDLDSETDVLSFPMEDDFNHDIPLLGDIIISLDKALDQAKDYGHTLERELVYLTVHSMFHLMGYDHLEEKDQKIMREKEKRVMKNLRVFRDSEGK